MSAFASLLAMASMASASPSPAPIELVCQGVRDQRLFVDDAARPQARSALQQRNGPWRRRATIEVQVNEQRGRIRLGESMLPRVYAGGRDGWWRLNDVQRQGEMITGSYRLNDRDVQHVAVNTGTGRVKITGAGGYEGACEEGRAFDSWAWRREPSSQEPRR